MSRTDGDLVTKAVGGDADALSALLERFGPQVRKKLAIGRRWQSVLSADDVMQITYIEAFLQIEGLVLRGDSAFGAWLKTLAENNLRDAIRELSRKKRPPPAKRIDARGEGSSYIDLLEHLGATTTTPSRVACGREAKSMIEAAMKQLPEDYATVVRLYDLEDLSGPEVGAAMNRSRGAVVMLRTRALDQLRQLLGASTCFFGR